MFLIPRRQIWTQQPQGAVEIDWTHPLAKGLDFAWSPGNQGLDVALKRPLTIAGATRSVSAQGVGLGFSGGLGALRFASNADLAWTQNPTIIWVAATAAVVNRTILGSRTTPGGLLSAFLITLSDYSLRLEGQNYGSSGFSYRATSPPSTVDGKMHCFAVAKRGDSYHQFYRDGAALSTTTLTSGPVYRQDNAVFEVGGINTGIESYDHNEPFGCFLIFRDPISDADIKALTLNPWQIFKRPDSRIFVPVSAGGGTTSLVVQDATHAHIADSPSFSMATYLAVAESLHAHAADNVTLATTGTANLVVQEATHAHVADGVSLTTQWLLAVAEALHSHTAESVTLSLQTALVVLEALHTHAAENLTLGVTGTANLTIADATSGHTSDTVALTLNSLLAVFDASHTHAADSLTLDTSNATALTVQDSTHAHGADSLGLSLDTWLAIVEAAHGHTADAPTLSTALALQVAESLHAHYADVVVLGFPSAPGSCPTVEEIVAAVLAALNATTIPVNAMLMNNAPIIGTGNAGDDWRGENVQPQ